MQNKHAEKYRKIGKQIKYYRKEKNLTQQELANKINISKSYLSKIEAQNCIKSFSVEVLMDIADALEVPVSMLLE